MVTSFESLQKRRLRSSYVSVVISIALVLFMIGILGLVMLKSKQVANHFKEELVMSLFLKDDISDEKIKSFTDSLQQKAYTKKLTYITKKEAAEKYQKDLGEDFIKFLGNNPLKNGIDLYLNASFVTPEKMEDIRNEISEKDFIFEISYDKPLVEQLTKNIKRISFWLLILSGIFGIIAILLINSSIRLAIYSKRFSIKTMQMVGATKSFIRKPFILHSIKLGLLGAILALIGISSLIYYIDQYLPSLKLLNDYLTLIYIAFTVIVGALLITGLSTFFAAQRFLNLQTNDLYY